MRQRIDISEIEAQTKIRAKYLRALENEEWDLLPGPTFVKSFLRTYAEALGLDARLLLEEAIRLVAQTQTASVSMVQRRLRVGYTRAGRLIDMLERRGVISGYEGSKPRQVLVGEGDVDRFLQNLRERDAASAPAEAAQVSE